MVPKKSKMKKNPARRRSARISSLQTQEEPSEKHDTIDLTSVTTGHSGVSSEENCFEDLQFDCSEAGGDFDDEESESITPANSFRYMKKGAIPTHVTTSASTNATTSQNESTNSPTKSTSSPQASNKHSTQNRISRELKDLLSANHILRRLPMSEDEDHEKKPPSRRKSSRLSNSMKGLEQLTGMKANDLLAFHKAKKRNEDSASKRKRPENNDPYSCADSTRSRNQKTQHEQKENKKKERANKRPKVAPTANKATPKSLASKRKLSAEDELNSSHHVDLPPKVSGGVPRGVFDLDALYKSAFPQPQPHQTSVSSLFHRTQSPTNKIFKTVLTHAAPANITYIPSNVKLNQMTLLTSREATGSIITNDDDTCFLAQYAEEYYKHLFQKDNQATSSFNEKDSTQVNSTLNDVGKLVEKSKLTPTKSKQVKATQVTNSTSSTPSTDKGSSSTCLFTMPKYMSKQVHLSAPMRAILVDWLIEISDEYKLKAHTLHMAVKLMDRALEHIMIQRKELQCLGCACMLIACKLEEVTPMSSADFVYVSDKSYSRKEITKMERDILNTLQFRCYRHVTPLHFIHRFVRAGDASFFHAEGPMGDSSRHAHTHTTTGNGNGECQPNRARVFVFGTNPVFQSMVEYLLEIALLQPEFVDLKSSLVATAAVYLGRATMGLKDVDGNIWNKTLVYYSGYDVDDLEEIVLKLHAAHSTANEEKLNCVVTKYKRKHFHEVALRPAILKEDLGLP